MDKNIITKHQLFTFNALSNLGGSIVVISAIMAAVAKQDAGFLLFSILYTVR